MKVLVCGDRDFTDKVHVFRSLDEVHELFWINEMCHGGARGVDSFALDWCLHNNIPGRSYPADWDKHGKAAGPIRNKQMLDEFKPDLVVAFKGGKGTSNMIEQALAANVWTLCIP